MWCCCFYHWDRSARVERGCGGYVDGIEIFESIDVYGWGWCVGSVVIFMFVILWSVEGRACVEYVWVCIRWN